MLARLQSSGGSDAGRFSGLIDLKRNSQDASAAARKASFHEQRPQPGFLGQIWHKYVVRTLTLFRLLTGAGQLGRMTVESREAVVTHQGGRSV